MRLSVFAAPLLLALSSCATLSGGALGDADVAAIRASNEAFRAAAVARDFEALAALYAEDAVLLPPNGPEVRGRAAIRAHFDEFPPILSLDVALTDVSGRGDLAYVHGTYAMTIPVDGADPVVDRGKFLEVRRRSADGSWPLVYDMYSSDLPPAGGDE